MAVAVEQFVKQLEDSGILAGETIKDFIPPKAAPKDAEDLARQLVKQKKLTKFQAEEVYRGKGKSLVIGNYLLMEKIGAGGMGQVFKARHRRMDRFVAIKLLPPAMTKDKAAISRFEREVKAAAKLRHPNIVAADDADCANGVHFLVMELVEGLDLSALVRKNGPLSTGKAVNYVLQAARGLEFAHRKGVVHRDIKPANLLLDTDGTVKILDMGLARLGGVGDDSPQADLTSTGTIMGTVDYMAPEQALDTKTADARADIYALGCSLHYLLTGKPTYDGDTIMKKLLAHRDQPIPSLRAGRSEVPGQLEVVFKKMIAKKLEDRYQTMGEVIADLKGMEVGQEATVFIPQTASELNFQTLQPLIPTMQKAKAKPPSLGNTGLPPRKNIKVLMGAGLLCLLLLAGIIVSLDTEDGKLIVEVDQADAMVQVLDSEGKVEVSQKGGGGKITISVDPGKHRLKVVKDGFTTYGLEFEMEKGGKREITARLERLDAKQAMVGTKPDQVAAAKKPLGFQTPGFDEWVKEVAALPAEQQVQAVGKKLVELNPGFDGKVTGDWSGQTKNDAGAVTAFSFLTDHVSDISPVRALTVRSCLLDCSASGPGKGILVDLSPLNGTQFTFVVVSHTQVSDLSPLRGMSLTHLNLTGTPVSDLSPIQGMNLTWISLEHSKVTDLSPLHGMQMEGLNLPFTNISDLSPLQGMNLTYLYCVGSPVSDLSPLKGMPLQILDLSQTQVSDLSPLQGMKLEALSGSQTLISDLSPLTGMPLVRLLIDRTTVTDLSPLRQMPLKFLSLDFKPERDTELLRSIKTLEMVNDKPIAEFWKTIEANPPGKPPLGFQKPGFDKWVEKVTALPAEQQVEAVGKKLVELNPGFDGNLFREINNDAVVALTLGTADVSDISPIRALAHLTNLYCDGGEAGNGKLADLSPLKGLNLTALYIHNNKHVSDLSPLKGLLLTNLRCHNTSVADLTPLQGMPLSELLCVDTNVTTLMPLKGMPLTVLNCHGTKIADLSPLHGMPLTYLNVPFTSVSDLSPLIGMKLTYFCCVHTPVSDLAPLNGMPLKDLSINEAPVVDTSPIRGMPLKSISLNFKPERDTELLRSIKTLEMVNDKPVAEFWKEVEGEKPGQ